MMSNIEELKILSKQLYDLLDKPESGLCSWHEAVHDYIDKIAAFHND